jgi:hypothetical protein
MGAGLMASVKSDSLVPPIPLLKPTEEEGRS